MSSFQRSTRRAVAAWPYITLPVSRASVRLLKCQKTPDRGLLAFFTNVRLFREEDGFLSLALTFSPDMAAPEMSHLLGESQVDVMRHVSGRNRVFVRIIAAARESVKVIQ